MLIAREVVLVERRRENPVTTVENIRVGVAGNLQRGSLYSCETESQGYYLNSRSNKNEVPNNGFHLEGGK